MRWVLLILGALAFSPRSVPAAELVMFESTTCEWCEIWDEEVGVVYDKTSESRIAPLRRVDYHDPRPPELQNLRRIIYTPTFVFMDQGREVGRIVGYPGESNFWELLGGLLEKLPPQAFGCNQTKKMASGGPLPTTDYMTC